MAASTDSLAPRSFSDQDALNFLFSEIRRVGMREVARRSNVPASTIQCWMREPHRMRFDILLRLVNSVGGAMNVTFLPSAVPMARRQVKRGRPPGGPGFWKD